MTETADLRCPYDQTPVKLLVAGIYICPACKHTGSYDARI